MSDDRYAKIDYRSLIAWGPRLEREWPLLDEILRGAPSKSILDLGSGTGEHARFLAANGFDVTGVDSSPAMLEKSRAAAGEQPNLRFLAGDMRHLANVVEGRFGAAVCLGNALPHLSGEGDLRDLADGLRRVLLPGAPFVAQIINYDRIEAKKERALPLTFLPDPNDPAATIIFPRTMEFLPDGRVIFMPTTLRQRPDRDEPLELVATQRVEIRGWRRAEIERTFREAGFASVEVFGSYQKAPFEAAESRDVILVAC
ncbi:MAG TPA: class I SAM-dependent methyltransferase [Thermoanaerobaculia bacterium]|nr:class I SAM-dependent methyltransferase [Thermoanaerobaculia bacterium]